LTCFQEPFQHESLLVDRKEKKLSQAEKRLAKRSYELEKQANINYSHRPQYSYYPGSTTAAGNPGIQGTGLQIRSDVLKNIFGALYIFSKHSRISEYVHLSI
jgi:hypothetical protein